MVGVKAHHRGLWVAVQAYAPGVSLECFGGSSNLGPKCKKTIRINNLIGGGGSHMRTRLRSAPSKEQGIFCVLRSKTGRRAGAPPFSLRFCECLQ